MKKLLTFLLLASCMLLTGLSYASASLDKTSDYLSIDNDVGVSIEYNYTLSANEVLQVGEFELVTAYVNVEPYAFINLSVLDVNKQGTNERFRCNTPYQVREVQTNPIRADEQIKPLHITDLINLRGLVNSFNKFDTKTV